MKNAIIGSIIALTGFNAQADGFTCTSESLLNVKVYNHTSPNVGTRSVSKMVVSDSAIALGNRTIATFDDAQSQVASYKQTYVANVDLRYANSNRKGELIGGTKLGNLHQIILSVDFSYARPVTSNTLLKGMLTLVKRDGEEIIEEVNCRRYLKH